MGNPIGNTLNARISHLASSLVIHAHPLDLRVFKRHLPTWQARMRLAQ